MFEQVHAHPEWKRLIEALSLKLEIGKVYTYDELNELAGVDIRSNRGRRQFFHFAREILERESLHFENVRAEGYRVVHPKEQGSCAIRRVASARRKLKHGGQISSHVRGDMLSPEARAIAIDLSMRIARLEQVVVGQTKEIKRLARGVELGRLPHPLLGEDKQDKESDVQ